MSAQRSAGWHADPAGRHERRYWDGSAWTARIADRGIEAFDPGVIPREQVAARGQRGEVGRELWALARTIQWSKLGSLRLWFAALLSAAIVAGGLGAIWQPLAYLSVPVFVLVFLGLLINPDYVLYCPHCRKRVKAGATVCHHCARSVV